jgi:ComEC/Rec2-related protein
VHSTSFWLGTLVALGGAFAWARASALGAPAIAAAIVVLVGIAAFFAAWAVVREHPGAHVRARGRAFRALFVAALALAAARGGSEALRLRDVEVAASRGGMEGMRRFEVVGASWPGTRCHVLARESVDATGPGTLVWMSAPPEACPLAQGGEISVPVRALHVRAGPRWPGDDDARGQAWGRGADVAVEVDVLWPSTPPRSDFFAWIAALRQSEWTRTRGDEAGAFVASSLFGLRVAMSPEQRDRLAAAGLGHLVAVSGMQVSLVAFAIVRLLARVLAGLGMSPAWSACVAAVPVVGYVVLCGAEAPAVRSAIMVGAVGIAGAVGRPTHGLCTLAWTAVAMLFVRPAWATDAGFQLSVVAMAALVSAPADAGLVLQSWRVAWAVAPVVCVTFGQTGAWAIVTNLIAVPVFTVWIVPLGVVGALTGWHEPARWGAELVLDVAAIAASLPRVSIGWAAIVGVVAIALRCTPAVRRREAWMRWLPSMLASLGVIAAWVVTARDDAARLGFDWVAYGGKRHHAVVVADPRAPSIACVRDPVGPATQWSAVVRGLGFTAVGAVEPEGPHVDDVVRRLELDDAWRGGADCRFPAAGAVRAAMLACARRHRPPVMAGVRSHRAWCFVDGAWHGPVGYDEP